ncbi:uncharacterized protein Pyn_00477 [Prunus yedoensis var. nudiflora]|uniref:Hydroxyproline-rich glycoprotein family protein n=1 Tax=Prunus yedoensis var. nudiflora TaxID=2094558 RepID=A0A314YD55_PRUYE|nr:uncharacterized protein Pyn_00477 [Prunus yedoensis var. nudiflora]
MKGRKDSSRPKSLPLKQKNASRRGMPKNRSFGDSGNQVMMIELRKKIIIFMDIIDLPVYDASAATDELVMRLMRDLQKLYPEIVLRNQLSELKGASTEQVLASFCKALKSIGESWMTNHDRLDKLSYDLPSFKEDVNSDQLVETVLATLDCLIKMARDEFDMMDDDDQKGEGYSPRNSSFGKFLSDSESCTSARKANVGSKSPLLWTLRVQAVGKLNPIDVKHLSLHLSKQGAHGTSNGLDKSGQLVEEPSIEADLESNPEKAIAATDDEEVRHRSSREDTKEVPNTSLDENANGKEIDNTSDDIETPTTAPETLEADTTQVSLPPPSPSTLSLNLPISSPSILQQPTTSTPPPLPSPSTLSLNPPLSSPSILQQPTTSTPPPLLPPTRLQFSLPNTVTETKIPVPPTPPSPPILQRNVATLPLPPPPSPSLATLQPTVAAPPPPPLPTLTPQNAAAAVLPRPPPPPPMAPRSMQVAPPTPPPTPMPPGSTRTGPPPGSPSGGPPPPPPPPGSSNGAPPPPPPPGSSSEGPPAPPPMLRGQPNGAAPPPPPAFGAARSLRPKKDTKLKRSSQMGYLYRLLKGKVEGSSLDGKSANGRKGGIGSSSGGKQGMADALAEMTKRSAYFQQIEEDAQKYAKPIMEMRTTLSSFQTKDMSELIDFHKKVESILEHLTDESQVLSRFEGFPTRKLETIRMAAALHSKLNTMLIELQNWKLAAPLGQLLDKSERYFNKIKGEIDAMDRTKDDEAKKFQSQNIHFDFNILIRIKEAMVDVSSSCMEMALKDRREAKAAENTGRKTDQKQTKICVKMLWRAFQFAFRVYTFAGGHDDRADMLTKELANEIESVPHHH